MYGYWVEDYNVTGLKIMYGNWVEDYNVTGLKITRKLG